MNTLIGRFVSALEAEVTVCMSEEEEEEEELISIELNKVEQPSSPQTGPFGSSVQPVFMFIVRQRPPVAAVIMT